MTDSQPKRQNPIRSLSEYFERITDLTSEEQKDHSKALFYRGHADSSWKLEPAVYRIDKDGKSHRDVELQMYQEMLRRSPQAFQDCKTTFERLVKMQHYGLPTRLLDLTQSPLVALYFACREKNEIDNRCNGKVFVIKAKKEDVYFQESLPSNTLSEFDFQYQVRDVLKYISRQYNNRWREFYQIAEEIEEDGSDLGKKIENITLELLKHTLRPIFTDSEEDFYNHIKISMHQHHLLIKEIINMELERNKSTNLSVKLIDIDKEIRKNISEKYHINTNIISILDLVNSYSEKRMIYPPLNNERIQKQQGAFIYFPKYYFFEETPNFSTEQILIAANKKTAILDELKTMGITKAYLFPELDAQANDIKNNIYPPA